MAEFYLNLSLVFKHVSCRWTVTTRSALRLPNPATPHARTLAASFQNDMLDFYIIEDDKPKPSDPGQSNLTYAGGLDDKTFDNLKRKGIIDDRFDYYSDFRWGTQLIGQIRQTIKNKKMEKDSDVKALLILLDIAGQQDGGLIAYGD